MKAGLLFVACAIGCRREPSAAPSPAPSTSHVASASSVAATSGCLPAKTLEGAVVHTEVDANAIRACFLDADRSPTGYVEAGQQHPCIRIDPTTLGVTTAPPFVVPMPAETGTPASDVTTTSNTVTVCPSPADKSKCKTLHPSGVAKTSPETPLRAFADATGEKVFVFVPTANPSFSLAGDIYLASTGARVAHVALTVPGARFVDSSNTWSGSFVAERRVVLTDAVCCGPASVTWLVDATKGTAVYLHGHHGEVVQHPPTHSSFALAVKTLSTFDPESLVVTPIVTAPGDDVQPWLVPARLLIVGATGVLVSGKPPSATRVDLAKRTAGTPVPLPLCTPTP